MPNSTFNLKIFLCCFFITIAIYSQKGVVTGILEEESSPLPGASIIIKGTTTGVETDFDGIYSIECYVGDVLVISFIGMATREITVTEKMFSTVLVSSKAQEEPVKRIISNAYTEALKSTTDSLEQNANTTSNNLTYNKNKYWFSTERIKAIKQKDDQLIITYFSPDIYYQIGFNSSTSYQFVNKKLLPKLQNSYAQGRPNNGENQWFGPEFNETFSFGPSVSTLTFDGSDYKYDTNGRIIEGTDLNQILPYKNSIFEPSFTTSNNLSLKVSNEIHNVNLNFRQKIQNDIFNIEKNRLTQFDFNYKFKKILTLFLKTSTNENNQPNINGFYNNIFLNNALTPTTFENSQGFIFSDNSQRSFSPLTNNNPDWLLTTNRNNIKSSLFLTGAKGEFYIAEDFSVNTTISYNKQIDNLNFALPINTVGFENGYRSYKKFEEENIDGYLALNYQFDIEDFSTIDFNSSAKYKHSSLNYTFIEESDFSDFNFGNPSLISQNNHNLNNNILRLSNEIKFDYILESGSSLSIKNNSVLTSQQGNEMFLPSIQAHIDLIEIIGYSNWLGRLSFAAGYSKEANTIPLYYSNQSHNSLAISPQESQSLIENNDLFNSKNLDLELATTFDIESQISLFYSTVILGANYYYSKSDNAIFPILNNGDFELQNVATIENRGFEASLELNIGDYWRIFHYSPIFIFSKNISKVVALSNGQTSIPIAGFTTVSKDLIVGEKTGTIVGSAYLRNSNSSIIIDNTGFPIVDSEKKIIGNSTPNFNLSFYNSFNIKKFYFNFLIDYQNGGDIWNGTQNVLNYHGRSQETADLRNTTSFIFEGVNQSGEINTIPVNFADPTQDISTNRWVRYGFSGVDEDAIVDGTYINLKSIALSYDFMNNGNATFFRQLQISVYANNLITITKSKGVSPQNSLFDYTTASGLDYFNSPMLQEIGFKLNIKI